LQLFGKEYHDITGLMFVFSLGIMGSLLIRVPVWNILAAIGWSKVRFALSVVSVIINIGLCYYLTKEYGLMGTVVSTSIMMWISGLLSLSIFYYYLKKS